MSTSLSIRTPRPTDARALDRLVSSTLDDRFGGDLSAEALRPSAYRACVVAEADGVVAGYAVAACDSAAATPACGRIAQLYVAHTSDDVSTEREVAEALVSALQGGDREIKIPVTTEDCDLALTMYDRWGFVDVDAVRRYLSLPTGHGRLM